MSCCAEVGTAPVKREERHGCCWTPFAGLRHAEPRSVTYPQQMGPMMGTVPDLGDVVDLLTSLIRFDTTNWGRGTSSGELAAATWVAEQLRSAGWAPMVLAPAAA